MAHQFLDHVGAETHESSEHYDGHCSFCMILVASGHGRMTTSSVIHPPSDAFGKLFPLTEAPLHSTLNHSSAALRAPPSLASSIA